MVHKIKSAVSFLYSGSERTQVVKKNIFGSFAIKGLSILTSLLLIPLTIHSLDQEKYGIWITLYSIVSWFNIMDIGLGNGFRNKFAESIAKGQNEKAQEYINTLYSSIFNISIGLFFIFLCIHPIVEWKSIFNVSDSFNENVNLLVIIVFALFCCQLLLKNISTILLAIQKTATSNSLLLIANVLSLIGIFVIQVLERQSLFVIGIVFMVAPVIVYTIATIVVFKTYLKEYYIKIKLRISKVIFSELMGLGIKFFIIQVTGIIIFSSANLIITQLYGPEYVTPYNIASRLFITTQSLFTIITTPFWTAFTEANAKNDFDWVRKSVRMLLKIWMLFALGIGILWLVSPFVYRIWIGKEVDVPSLLSLQFAILAIISTFQSPFIFYIYGVGKIKVVFIITLIQSIVFVPLALLLADGLNMESSGVILATNICLLIPAILGPIQYRKLINNEAVGIWNK